MAKNKSRGNKPSSQTKPKNAAPTTETSKAQAKQKEVLYQVRTKRDSGVLKVYTRTECSIPVCLHV